MEKFLKENLIIIVVAIAAFAGLLYFAIISTTVAIDNNSMVTEKEMELQTKQQKLDQLKRQNQINEEKKKNKKTASSGKVIYEVLGQQFSPEASFGIMFENLLANMTNSGVRIRSIDYNYLPQDDKIMMTNVAGYNACELSFTTVSTYSQLQTFFKNIIKEKYLSNIAEIYIEPYDNDKTILISKFKVRLYTRTI